MMVRSSVAPKGYLEHLFDIGRNSRDPRNRLRPLLNELRMSPESIFSLDKQGWSLVDRMAATGEAGVLAALLKQRTPVLRKSPRTPTTILGNAVAQRHTTCVERILEMLIQARKEADDVIDFKKRAHDAQWRLSLSFLNQDNNAFTKDIVQLAVYFPDKAAKFLDELGLMRAERRLIDVEHQPKVGSRVQLHQAGYGRGTVRYYNRSQEPNEDKYVVGVDLDLPVGHFRSKEGYFTCASRGDGDERLYGIVVDANKLTPIANRDLCEARLPKSQMIVTSSDSPNPIDLWSEMFPHGDYQSRAISKLEDEEFSNQPAEARFVVFRDAAGQLEDFEIEGTRYTSMLDAFVRIGHEGLFGNASIRAVIKYKWNSFAETLFMIEFVLYMISLVLLTALAFIPKTSKSGIYGCYVGLGLELLIQMRNEWCQISYSWRISELQLYYLDPWNIIQPVKIMFYKKKALEDTIAVRHSPI